MIASRRFTARAGLLFPLALFALGALKTLGCSAPQYLGETHTCRASSDCNDLPGTSCGESNLCICTDEDQIPCCQANYDPDRGDCELACRVATDCSTKPFVPCSQVASASSTTGGQAGAGGMGGGGGAMGGGGSGGGEEVSECMSPLQCPPPADLRCGHATCEKGKCGLVISSGPTESQIRGDCKTTYCDNLGNAEVKLDLGDFYNDGKPCTLDICKDGLPSNEPYPDGVTCPEIGSGVCHVGACVACIAGAPINYCPMAGDVCVADYCESPACGAACGNGCVPCPPAYACVVASDCAEGVCTNNMCAIPSCTDGVKNDGETGIDCGAPSCPNPCPDGQGCALPTDCVSGVCWGAQCQAPTCADGIENGNEIGPDCGGDCSLPCKIVP